MQFEDLHMFSLTHLSTAECSDDFKVNSDGLMSFKGDFCKVLIGNALSSP